MPNQNKQEDYLKKLAEHFLQCYETAALVDIKLVEQTIHQEVEKGRVVLIQEILNHKWQTFTNHTALMDGEKILSKMEEFVVIKAKDVSDYLLTLHPTNNTKETK